MRFGLIALVKCVVVMIAVGIANLGPVKNAIKFDYMGISHLSSARGRGRFYQSLPLAFWALISFHSSCTGKYDNISFNLKTPFHTDILLEHTSMSSESIVSI